MDSIRSALAVGHMHHPTTARAILDLKEKADRDRGMGGRLVAVQIGNTLVHQEPRLSRACCSRFGSSNA